MSKTKDKINNTKYQHIVAWGRYLGSGAYYIEDQIDLAEKEEAPVNALYKREGVWHTFDDITDVVTKARIESAIN